MFKTILLFLSFSIMLFARGRENPFMPVSDLKKDVIVIEDKKNRFKKKGKRVTIITIDENGNKIWVRKNANERTLAKISRKKKKKKGKNRFDSKSERMGKIIFRSIVPDITNRVRPEKSLKYFHLDESSRVRLLKPFSFLAIDFHKKHIIITTKNKVRSKKYISQKNKLYIDITADIDFDKKSYQIDGKLVKSIFIQPLRGFFRLNINLNPKAKIGKIKTKSLKNIGHLIIF